MNDIHNVEYVSRLARLLRQSVIQMVPEIIPMSDQEIEELNLEWETKGDQEAIDAMEKVIRDSNRDESLWSLYIKQAASDHRSYVPGTNYSPSDIWTKFVVWHSKCFWRSNLIMAGIFIVLIIIAVATI